MRIITINKEELHISNDLMRDISGDIKGKENINYLFHNALAPHIFEAFLSDKKIKRYLELYKEITGLEDYACLEAHGSMRNGHWVYHDGKNTKKVQNWINKYDGQFLGLFLSVCNPEATEIKSKKSLVLASNKEFSCSDIDNDCGQIELYVPDMGYIDKYCFDHEILKLERRLG